MRTVETIAEVTADNRLTVQVPADILPGEHKVVLVFDENAVAPAPKTKTRPPLNLKGMRLENWPADCRFSRAEIYNAGL